MINRLRKYAAFRWVMYLSALVLMCAHGIAKTWSALQVEFGVWRAMVEIHERGWKQRTRK